MQCSASCSSSPAAAAAGAGASVAPLRTKAPCRCLQRGCRCACAEPLYEDDGFCARWNVLYNPSAAADWMRPHEMCKEPMLCTGGRSRFEVRHTLLKNSWFIAACSAMADHPHLMKQVLPEGQVLFGADYDGSVTFRLWHLGQWIEVKIDDRLPVDRNGVPIYSRCEDSNVFWLPLLEKAFAKFYGSYSCIYEAKESYFGEGLSKLTGYCLSEMELTRMNAEYTFEYLKKHADEKAMVLCKPRCPANRCAENFTHSVARICHKSVTKATDEKRVIRLTTPWSTKSQKVHFGNTQLKKRSEEIKMAMSYSDDDDEEEHLWMDISDFCENFSHICIGTERPLYGREMKMLMQIMGCWSGSADMGGHPHDIEKFAKNPQFLLVALGDGCDMDHDSTTGVDTIVELVQEHNQMKRSWDYKISFYIFEVYTEKRLTPQQLLQMNYVTGDTECQKVHSVQCRMHLYFGRRYVIIPTTCTSGYEGNFLIRVFCRDARLRLEELQH